MTRATQMLSRALLAVVSCLLLASQAAYGQISNSAPLPQNTGARSRDEARDPLTSPQAEMIERAAIKFEEEAHRENLERARENAQLGVELRASFESHKALGREDLKKLARMEKLARSIRGRIGGSDGDVALENPPRDLSAALPRLAELSEELKKSVEKTSRHVVSTAVIERSNELIELLRHIRSFTQK